ncbi:hypothetical protein [Spiroplasma endosymbiont of Polydrusus formosus]|uniref:hypothetical protein n=1 Tax=Spiroplasma endosymbiont of Polydrusus formosus TaxID=3139326 RepID=UPI0035B5010D
MIILSSEPLEQGVCCYGVEMVLAEQHLAAKLNKPDYKIIDNYTYVLCGNGNYKKVKQLK